VSLYLKKRREKSRKLNFCQTSDSKTSIIFLERSFDKVEKYLLIILGISNIRFMRPHSSQKTKLERQRTMPIQATHVFYGDRGESAGAFLLLIF
jgi:hypothetical protein